MATITYGSKTDVGRVRKMNQDSLAVLTAGDLEGLLDGLFVVADGMGGKAGGEIASRVTVETVPAVVQEALTDSEGDASDGQIAEALREAIEAANEVVYKQARANPELRGMGTTCVAALIRNGSAIVGHVGDSRVYLLRGGRLAQLTEDHSLVQEHVRAGEMSAEEARGSRFKNVITRAVGIAERVAPEIKILELAEGDTLLLCSDGLTNMVSDSDIVRMLGQDTGAQEVCDALVEAALQNGGDDNITALVVRNGAFRPQAFEEPEPLDEEFFKSAAAGPTVERSTGRSGVLSYVMLITLVIVLGGALISVGRETYDMTSAYPFFMHKKKDPPKPVPPVPPDLAHLTYDDPVAVSQKPVRGAPIACDAAGNVYVVTKQSGSTLRISPDGKTSPFISSEAAPAPVEATKHWAVDPQGNMYVSSKAEKTIHKYDANGTRVGSPGEGKLTAPEGIAVDGQGDIYVVDENRLKVLKAHAVKADGTTDKETRRQGDEVIGDGVVTGAGVTFDPNPGLSVEGDSSSSKPKPRKPGSSQDGPR
jgi:serine/threonine protein phosphatase PrpC